MTTEEVVVSETERVLAEMFMERVGHSILDSGQSIGRAYQQDLLAIGLDPGSQFGGAAVPTEDDATLWARLRKGGKDIVIDDIGDYVSVDTWKFLAATLNYQAHADKVWRRWTRLQDAGKERYDRDSWDLQALMFLDRIGAVMGGMYGESKPSWVYTYNEETWFDRDFLYLQFRIEHPAADEREWLEPGDYAFVQIHNGADARGGFTEPRLFSVSGDGGLYNYGSAGFGCEGQVPDITPGQQTIEGGDADVRPIFHTWSVNRDFADSENPLLVILRHGEEQPKDEGSRWTPVEYAWRDEDGAVRCPRDGTVINAWYYPE